MTSNLLNSSDTIKRFPLNIRPIMGLLKYAKTFEDIYGVLSHSQSLKLLGVEQSDLAKFVLLLLAERMAIDTEYEFVFYEGNRVVVRVWWDNENKATKYSLHGLYAGVNNEETVIRITSVEVEAAAAAVKHLFDPATEHPGDCKPSISLQKVTQEA